MKRFSLSPKQIKFKPIMALLLPIAVIFGAAIAPPQTAHAAEGTMTCTTEIELNYTGFASDQSVSIDITYDTGQSETIAQQANAAGEISMTIPRYSNDVFEITARVVDGDSTIGASIICPAIVSETSVRTAEIDTFVCEPAFYQVLGSTLHRLDAQTFEYEILGSHARKYNAIGYNTVDNYLYGIERINSKSTLIKINNRGVITNLGEIDIPSSSWYRGDFGLGQELVVTNGSNLYSIDVTATPPTVTKSQTLTKVNNPSLNFHDIAFNRVTGTFYTYTQGQVIEIDPEAGTIEALADYSAVVDGKPFGAAFSDVNGDIYFSKNSTGAIYFADLDSSGAVLNFYPLADGKSNGNNDGASCPLAAPPFEMSCTDKIDNDLDGLTDANDPDCFDMDGDLVIAIQDLDDDNDGIPDVVEMESATNNGDSDGDGLLDKEDLDSNGNAIFDYLEAGTGGTDSDADGRIDGEVGSNGLVDSIETSAESGVVNYTPINSDPSTPPDYQALLDSDGDGFADLVDLDDDNDGIPDSHECTYSVDNLPIAVVNGSFEYPDIDFNLDLTLQRWGGLPHMATTFADSNVQGWSTTASDGRIEIWQSGHAHVAPNQGEQHAEINANGMGALYQDVSTTPETTMIWSFAHRGRGGPDTIQLNIGEAGGTLTTVQTMTTDRSGWVVYSGEYVVPAGQTVTRFEYEAVSTGSGNNTVGNFLDDIQFYMKPQSTNCTTDTDGDLIVDALDLDADGDGYPDAYESGHGYLIFNADGSLAGEVGDNGMLDAVETSLDSGILTGSIRDSDEDGTPDFQQFDDVDGDGVLESDLDYDNDGIRNADECAVLPCYADFDKDGVPNALDLDSDNDGVNDFYELRTLSDYVIFVWYPSFDADGDGMVDGNVGTNGYLDQFETEDTQSATYNEAEGAKPMDDDNDGALNILDLDFDGDGEFDIDEAGLGEFDADLNGHVDDKSDYDFDGIADEVDGKKNLFGDRSPPGLVVNLGSSRLNIGQGETVEYRAVIQNVGIDDAQNLTIEVSIPDQFNFGNGESGTWSLATLAAGTSYTLTWETDINQITVNQSYDVAVQVKGEDGEGNAIIENSIGLNPADVDPDDADLVSLMGVQSLSCESYAQNIAYEDLKNAGWSDWDYNDLVVELDSEICYTPAQTSRAVDYPYWMSTYQAASVEENACTDVTVEAESGALYGFTAVNAASASGGQYVATEDLGIYDGLNTLSSSRMMTYTVDIPVTGIYQVVGLAQGMGPQSDSFWFEIGNEAPMIWDIGARDRFERFYLKDRNNNYQTVSYELEAGEHVLTIYNREDGSRLDTITFDCQTVIETPEYAFASTTITYTLLARGAGYDHALIHNLPFEDGGTYTLTLFDGGGNQLSQNEGTFDPKHPIEIFESTKEGLPPYVGDDSANTQTNTQAEQVNVIKGHTAVLTFVVNHPEKYLQGELNPFPWDLYLYVDEIKQNVHLTQPGRSENTQLVNRAYDQTAPLIGHNLPLAFVFDEDWTWPTEFTGIWFAFPEFVNYIDSGRNLKKTWFEQQVAVDDFLWAGRNGLRQILPKQEVVDSRFFASPVVQDIDQDGELNIITGDLLGNRVSVLDLEQNVVWSQETRGGVRATAVVEDLDFDGDLELMVSDEAGYIHAWHHDGEIVASFPISVTGSRLLASPTVVDLDNSGELEILQVASDGFLYVFDLKGILVWKAELSKISDDFGSQSINGSAVAEDIDGDGDFEVIVPDIGGSVLAFDHLGNLLWSFGTGDSVTSTPVIDEFDPTNKGVEIIFGSNDASIYVIDQYGELVWKEATGWTIRASPTLFDSDGDGYDELFIGSDDQSVYAFHYWGDAVSGWPQKTNGELLSKPVMGDIDADGDDEVLIGGEDGKLYAWDADGTPIQSWPKQTGITYKGSPVVINADADAEEEIFAVDFSGEILVWGLSEEAPIIDESQFIYLPMINTD